MARTSFIASGVATAVAADSVAVNQPKTLPPTANAMGGFSVSERDLTVEDRELLRAAADQIADALGIRATDRAVLTLPLSYSYGLSVLHSHLTVGAALAVHLFALGGSTGTTLLRLGLAALVLLVARARRRARA